MPNSVKDGMESFYRETRRALLRYVRKLVPSRDTAEELVQEAYLRTYERSATVETPRAFLFTTARNLASNELRQQRVRKTTASCDLDSLILESPGRSPETQALQDEESRLLKGAMERLPPQCRAVFILRVFHGCTYQDIADRLGLAPKTVENHLSRGFRETHEYLKRHYR